MEAGAATAPSAARTREGGGPGGRRRGAKLLDLGLNLYALLALLYLLVPILVILVFSFNNPVGRFNFVWQEFSLDAWTDPFGVPGIGDALLTSVEIAALSTLAATALGTITALALVRYEFKGRAPVNFFIFVPLATPEVVLGAALLSMFLNFLVATGFQDDPDSAHHVQPVVRDHHRALAADRLRPVARGARRRTSAPRPGRRSGSSRSR